MLEDIQRVSYAGGAAGAGAGDFAGSSRAGDRAGDRAGERAGERTGDRTGDRVGERTGERAGDRTGDRAGDRGDAERSRAPGTSPRSLREGGEPLRERGGDLERLTERPRRGGGLRLLS